MRLLGVVLITAGLVGFLVTGISYTTTEDVLDVGPRQVEREKEQSLPITPVVSGILVLIGGAVFVAGIRQEDG